MAHLDARLIEVLMVEDNPDDVDLTREALREVKAYVNMQVASDGIQALAILRHEGKYADAPRPNLILLDLNLPRMDGRELLAEIKNDLALRRIPVVVVTTSQSEEDIFRAYDLHANSYVTKPVDLDQFIRAIRGIEGYWLTIVKLPNE